MSVHYKYPYLCVQIKLYFGFSNMCEIKYIMYAYVNNSCIYHTYNKRMYNTYINTYQSES